MAAIKKRNSVVIAVVIMVVAIILSSFVYLNTQKPYMGNVQNIVYGDLVTGSSALIYVAQEQHFFSENGINFTIQNYTAGTDTIKAEIDNQIDIAFATEFAFVASGALRNENISVIASVEKFDSFYLVARRDFGVQNASDLNGKKVGLSVGTAAQFYLGRFCDLNGIDINNLTIVNVPFSQTVEAIANGTVDAVVTFSPYTDQIQEQLANNVVTWSVQSDQAGYGLLVCRDSWVSQHPDLVIRFLKALNQAENYVTNNPSAAKNITQKALNRTDTEMAEYWSQHFFSLSLDQSLMLAMQDEAQWLIRNHLTNATTVPYFINYVYQDGLKSVKPGAVNIIG